MTSLADDLETEHCAICWAHGRCIPGRSRHGSIAVCDPCWRECANTPGREVAPVPNVIARCGQSLADYERPTGATLH